MGKKLSLSVMGLLVVGAIYYFTAGSTQITAEMKKQLNTQLVSIEKEGFSVQNREVQEQQEHFILSFDEPAKIAHFFSSQGIILNVNDAELLKGLKIGVDVTYLPSAYASISFDIYPVSLPTFITSSARDKEAKKALAQVEKMLEKQTFLMHIDVNKLGTGFKGNMKDIDEQIQGEKNLQVNMRDFTFSGDIKEKRISSVKQTLKTLMMQVVNEMNFSMSNIKSDYTLTGKTPYDYSVTYTIENVGTKIDTSFDFSATNLLMTSISKVANGLASGSMVITVAQMNMLNKDKKFAFEKFAFATNAAGINVAAFEKLQYIDVNNEDEVSKVLQEMLSEGIQFEISKFSVENIIDNNAKLGGFYITAKVDLDKSFDFAAVESNPISLLSSVDANLNLMVSKELFDIIAQQPQTMMALMMFQPKDVNGEKVYKAELKDGKLSINGNPLF